MDVIWDLEKIDQLCEQAAVASETAVVTPTPFTTQNLGGLTQTISDRKQCLDDDDIEEVMDIDISKVITDGGKQYDSEKIDTIRREIDETAAAAVNREHVSTNSSLERREPSECGLSLPLARLPSVWQHTSPQQQQQPRRHASPAQMRPPIAWKTSEWPGLQLPTASSLPCLIPSGEGRDVKPHGALSSQPGCSWWKDDASAPPACEPTGTRRTPVSPMMESVMTQAKDSKTFNVWDENACMPTGTPRRSSLTSRIDYSNTMDTSTEITCLRRRSSDSPTEGSGATQGISPVSPVESSMTTLGAEFNTIKIETNDYQFFSFHPRVVNRTDIVFSEEESMLLNKSLKLIIEPVFDKKIAMELIVAAMSAIELGKLKQHEQWRVGYKLWKAIDIEMNKFKEGMINQKSRVYQSAIESVNKKLSEGKAVARMADEGDFIVIVREDEYIRKTLSYFEENFIIEIPHDITGDFQTEINKCCRYVETIMKYHTGNSTAPELTPLLKVHKGNISIRPIINIENSPAYVLTNLLDPFLRKNYVFGRQYSVSSTMALINEIKSKPITNSSRMATMTIRNLYANVAMDEVIEIVENNFIKYGKVTTQNTNEIVKLLKLLMNFNYFSFNNKFYKQYNGLALGTCLSDTMADIFINNLEHNVLMSDRLLMEKIVYYRRNVDKMLLLVDGTEDDIENILSKFNSFHNRIEFSLEHENNNRIQFLDLEIKRLRNELAFNVFRKPTTTDVIPSDSCHPDTDKEAAFRSLLHRAYSVPMTHADRVHELNIIKQIAKSNGYKMNMVTRLMDEERMRKWSNENGEQIKDGKKRISTPYYGEISKKLEKIFKSYNVKFTFQMKNFVLYSLISGVGVRKRKFEQAGVYKIKCASCGAMYIGQTKRTFLTRYKEHMDACRLGNVEKSCIAKHMIEEHHKLGEIEDDLEVLHIEEDTRKRELFEQLEIAIHKRRFGIALLNKQTGGTHKEFIDGFVELFLYYKHDIGTHHR